jgi:hypothetical protein
MYGHDVNGEKSLTDTKPLYSTYDDQANDVHKSSANAKDADEETDDEHQHWVVDIGPWTSGSLMVSAILFSEMMANGVAKAEPSTMPIGPAKMLASTVAPVRTVTYVHSAAAHLASSCALVRL